MSLKSLMQYLEKRAAGTSATAATSDTPDTYRFNETSQSIEPGQFSEAVNDPADGDLPDPPELVQPKAPAPDKPVRQTPMQNAGAWRELAAEYHRHHFKCPVCISAGRGTRYGLRCGAGAALWSAYSSAA